MKKSTFEELERLFPIDKFDVNTRSPVELKEVLGVLRDLVDTHEPTELNLYISKGPSGNYQVDIRYKHGEKETQR